MDLKSSTSPFTTFDFDFPGKLVEKTANGDHIIKGIGELVINFRCQAPEM